eukprot:CAMPEP_0172565466 /NCGR_PEP_ID=MMETSP1067-20121228/108201_1 /TAXON_ID=265564 ORGANISM="Thalassiosira punctigera, Strain Tpunct2005C2" /NCGR_SAMPLE_ID=MMETSP1067 /ASSEMBLY_ACC=CAM_ASM_000444 /LENGTH=347 /DNA_ID=CAMNT_0013356341 /DNA_START=285 /DNA_END=1324 /DNA_ORIENTATION=-
MIESLPLRHCVFFSVALSLFLDGSQAFCPYIISPPKEVEDAAVKDGVHRYLYDSLSHYSEEDQTCPNNCFMNDGGNLESHHQTSDGSALTTFDVMASLSENDGGSDMCVFSFQELSIPNNEISAELLLELIYLGDSAGRRMHEIAQSNSDNILLAACTLGRIGATEACSNAKRGVKGYNFFVTDDDDNNLSGMPTYYKDRFCKSAVAKTEIDQPQAVTIFRLNSDNLENAEALLGEFREGHTTNMQWAYENQIGADGHLLAKVVPCDQIPEEFKNPSEMYQNLADDNSVCDYVGTNGKQFVQEALHAWVDLCSVWPQNEDGSPRKCHRKKATGTAWKLSLAVVLVGA